MAEAPLAGVRVIELARVLAGPWAGQLLADLGADVIKIEKPDGGDETRHWGPPFLRDKDGTVLSSAYYQSANRGKRSVALDIAAPEGQQAVRALAADADVVIENFKVGGLKKYGLDSDSLRALNARLIYCSITGFGQDGPYAARPGYDFIIQAMAGMMSITGEAGREPQKAGVAISDIFTGLYAVIAILAALRHADKTGEGQYIDMALFDTMAGVLGNQNLNYLVSGVAPVQMGNAHMNIAPYEVFPVADGHIIIAIGNDAQFDRLCALLKADAIACDPDFQSNPKRVENRARLRGLLIEALAGWTKADILAACDTHSVPAGPINSIAEMFADPQTIARRLRMDIADAKGNPLPAVRAPILLPETPLVYERPAPRLGEHTQEVLAELEARRR